MTLSILRYVKSVENQTRLEPLRFLSYEYDLSELPERKDSLQMGETNAMQ